VFAPGFRAEVWLEPGASARQGKSYDDSDGGLCAILGAGNYEAPIDVLTKMFVENKVVVYKPNPVNALGTDILRKILAPLIDADFMGVISGGADAGQALVAHADVDEILMTGSAATYDRIVWGTPDEQADNKNNGAKKIDKPFDAELGGCSPVIVVPGDWTDAELDHHAAQLAATKVLNGSHVCASPQVIVVDESWPQRGAFMARVRQHLDSAPADPSYYPNASARQEEYLAAYDGAEKLGPKVVDNQLKRILIADAGRDSLAVKEEAFCPVLAEVAVEGGSAKAFLSEAVRFCNDELFGSLSASLLVDPRTADSLGDALDDAVAELRYGAIGVNVWGANVMFFGQLPWGAHPGHTAEDIQSGIGKLNNSYMLDGAQKAVLWTPFVSPVHPKPASPRDRIVAERMTRYVMQPSVGRLVKMMSGALLGI
jgi:acyl-CoA reductase-like NAD-dependent aldehyde dehydrogenase